ncbi:hypothetical protein [Ensifer sp. SSB1]|jgi:hypothetical protein|uniref:hypothetical protein n=1 Tax=Ensifer sp. SSB1 TaxID=2795385 RepID=UPI001A646BF6|nr:hypothetical protein [Ensifer sp. SSB1]MBK5571605.1 hypothetical protein [Ensifer sp. SSB1]
MESCIKFLSEISLSLQKTSNIVPDLSNRPDAYIVLEDTVLVDACITADECPGEEWEIWSSMAEVFAKANAELRSVGAHELKLVDYGTFLAMIEIGSELPGA